MNLHDWNRDVDSFLDRQSFSFKLYGYCVIADSRNAGDGRMQAQGLVNDLIEIKHLL